MNRPLSKCWLIHNTEWGLEASLHSVLWATHNAFIPYSPITTKKAAPERLPWQSVASLQHQALEMLDRAKEKDQRWREHIKFNHRICLLCRWHKSGLMEWELACLTRLQVMHSSNVQEIQFKATEIKKFQGHFILNWNKRQWGLKNRDGKMWKIHKSLSVIIICHLSFVFFLAVGQFDLCSLGRGWGFNKCFFALSPDLWSKFPSAL